VEEELNYLSEKIEVADFELVRLKQNKACLCSVQAKDYYTEKITQQEQEIKLLNNILSALIT